MLRIFRSRLIRLLLGALSFAFAAGAAADIAAAGAKVSIKNFAFAPSEVTISAGQSVTWVNEDGAPHGIGYRDGAQGVNPLLRGESFSRTFGKPGTYDYVCSVHPFMKGKVLVRAP